MREKHLGIWQSWTWAQVADEVRWLACGLAAQGFCRGMNLAIIGDNRPRLYWGFAAAQALGAVPVPLYQDAITTEMEFVLNDAEIEFALVEDQEQVDKLLEIKARAPRLRQMYYDDPRGMRHYSQPELMSYDRLRELGQQYDREHPEFFARAVDQTRTEEVSVMLYTSGTTGKPKGVCHTHASLIAAARGDVGFDGFTENEEVLSYLPMAWVGDHLFSYAQAMVAGFAVSCPESSETVMIDMREIGPTYYFGPPRVFENLLTQVTIRMDDAAPFKRRLYQYFMGVARRCGSDLLEGRPVSFKDRLLYGLGNLLIYAPLKNVLGMSRIRVAYTGGAAISPELYGFYRSLGINLKQLYGQTETAAYVCKQASGQTKLDVVGRPLPGVEVKIAANGEVLVKTPSMLKEYYKRPDATAESITPDGYFMTGDAGFLDADGDLKIIDRAKDVGRLLDGTLFAPQFIENKLKFFPHVKEAVCFGDKSDRVCAFINIDMQSVGNWAEKNNLSYGGYVDLAGKPEVYALIQECVARVNADLAEDEQLAGSQVRRFLILHKELDADDDELTRTRKVRRGFIAEKYAPLVEALFSERDSQYIQTQVKFEDGRTGQVEATLRIQSTPIQPGNRKAA